MNSGEALPRKSRNSSIELLRIIAMFLIIMAHLSGHGIMHMGDLTTNDQVWLGGDTI